MQPSEADSEICGAGGAAERRKHRRLAVRLPLECRVKGCDRERTIRAVTANISTGGVYFEAELSNGDANRLLGESLTGESLLELELTIPPGEGHFPYERQVRSVVQAVRRDELPTDAAQGGRPRIGVAGRFHEPLKFAF